MFRYAVGAVGVALMGLGGTLILTGASVPWDVAVWLAGSIALHDAVIAPLVLAAGLLLSRVPASSTMRGVVRGALIVAGCLTAVVLPVLVRPGGVANSSVLPLDYVRNWLLALGAVAVVAGGWACTKRVRLSRRELREEPK
ncbi:hypothetical protein ACFYQ5_31275 [Streptomyces sp. NPDC005794]|uniref:hypothetical protein n=1 Tax=Streptomyces sp. NPDC005794 TaxID=3364733 RepID=UPI0036D17319